MGVPLMLVVEVTKTVLSTKIVWRTVEGGVVVSEGEPATPMIGPPGGNWKMVIGGSVQKTESVVYSSRCRAASSPVGASVGVGLCAAPAAAVDDAVADTTGPAAAEPAVTVDRYQNAATRGRRIATHQSWEAMSTSVSQCQSMSG